MRNEVVGCLFHSSLFIPHWAKRYFCGMARLHPYNFTHVLLPQLAWRRPVSVRRELTDPYLAKELLLYVWDKAAENLPASERVASCPTRSNTMLRILSKATPIKRPAA